MSKKKVLYCWECGKNTVHELVNKEKMLEDCPVLLRGFMAVASFGVSEIPYDVNYQCTRCGELRHK